MSISFFAPGAQEPMLHIHSALYDYHMTIGLNYVIRLSMF